MARMSGCNKCKKQISKEDKQIFSGKGYCKDCYEEMLSESEDYKLLISTICQTFSISVPSGLILKQIKQYKEEFQYSHAGMTYTLWYIKSIEGKSFSEVKYGIALVKYFYEKAKQYFEQQQRIRDSVNDGCGNESKIKEVKVNLGKVYSKKNEFLIDINELLGGE